MRNYLLAGGVVGCLPFLAAAFSVATSNKVSVKARIASIDRQCDFYSTAPGSNGDPIHADCSLTSTFADMRDKAKGRTRNLKGIAKVTLAYTAPGRGERRTGMIEFTGRDDEFYALHYGDMIDIKVDRNDPSKIARW
jgi:hypothetical protein